MNGRIVIGICLLGLRGFAQVPQTLIEDTLAPASPGATVNGSINVGWGQFSYGSTTIASGPATGQNFAIVGGAVKISLVPTDHGGAPAPVYKVVSTFGGQPTTTYWQVPTLPSSQCASSSFCTVLEVTVPAPSSAAISASGGLVSVRVQGAPVGASETLNFVAGAGINYALSDTGGEIIVQDSVDSAYVETRSMAQAGQDLSLACNTASGTAYGCATNGALLTAYTNQQVFQWKPDADCGVSPTINVSSLGAKGLYRSDGSAAQSGDCHSGAQMTIWYDATLNSGAGGFRLPVTPAPYFTGTLDQVMKGNGSSNGATTSNCQITGSSNGDFQCPHTISTGDSSLPGAEDLVAPSGNFVTWTVGTSTATYVVQMPLAVPGSTGLALKVSSISTTVVNGSAVPLVVMAWE